MLSFSVPVITEILLIRLMCSAERGILKMYSTCTVISPFDPCFLVAPSKRSDLSGHYGVCMYVCM